MQSMTMEVLTIAKWLLYAAVILRASKPLWMRRLDVRLNNGVAPSYESPESPTVRLVRRINADPTGRICLILVGVGILIFAVVNIGAAIGGK